MAYCADTNVLLRWVQPETDASRVARAAVKALHLRGETVYVTPQNLIEFWTVATRPAEVNGLGLSPIQAEVEMAKMERLFPLLPDTAAIYQEWRKIVVDNGTIGPRSHDARLAAALRIHGVTHILTFNVSDFRSFGNPAAVHPSEIAGTQS